MFRSTVIETNVNKIATLNYRPTLKYIIIKINIAGRAKILNKQ